MSISPQKKTPWRVAGKSDVGVVRRTNEDAFLCDEARGFFAVADGVGGLDFGEKASRAAVESAGKIFGALGVPATERPDFSAIFRKIDEEIGALGESLVPGFGIATTLDVVVDGGNGTVHFAHLGDSGIFLFRGNELVLLSEEHTMATAERARGNENFPVAYANTLTRALGVGICCEPQVFSLALKPGDRILVATDGITRALPSRRIEKIVGTPAGTPEKIADALIAAANDCGGNDNSTAVLAFF